MLNFNLNTKFYCTFLTWVGPFILQVELKCTQMNNEMNCLTTHKCTEMYSNVLQTARVHWQVPVLFNMVGKWVTSQAASNEIEKEKE